MSKNAKAIFEGSPQLHRSFQSCVICHTVEEDENHQVSINWHTWSENLTERGFTKFAHTPHATLQCQQCHVVEAKVDAERFKNSFKRLNPLSFEPVFQSMDKASCVNCHVSQTVGDSCLLCHQYHIGKYEQRMAKSRNFRNPPAPQKPLPPS